MKKATQKITAFMMAATMAVSGMAAIAPMSVSAETTAVYKIQTRTVTDEELERGEYDELRYAAGDTDQYHIMPNKYYYLVALEPKHWWLPNERNKNVSVIKVLNVYEDPKWYGSERTVEYMDLSTGRIDRVQPNANAFKLSTCYYFYEIYRGEKIVEKIRVR